MSETGCPVNGKAMRAIENAIWPRGERRDVWVILDSARDPEIYGTHVGFWSEDKCLYRGAIAPELKLTAPYLLQLDYEAPKTRRLLTRSLGRSWGIYFKSDSTLQPLRSHFRRLLMVQDYTGRKLAFRFYDPRVLRVYLPTCTRGELRQFFGPVEKFWMDAEQPETLLEFAFDGEKLTTRLIAAEIEAAHLPA